MSNNGLILKDIVRRFPQGKDGFLDVLRGASLRVAPGSIVSLVGPSGSGKSTLLQIAGLLEAPDQGEVWVAGQACQTLNDSQRTQLRSSALGFVYQYHHLLPEFSALENVIIPQMIAGVDRHHAADHARHLLGRMGLSGREEHRPGQLSGGEQQRVAIARALANNPKVLLADEPTGNLDPETSEGVFQELLTQVRAAGVAALIATHNADLAARMDHTVRLQQGQLVQTA